MKRASYRAGVAWIAENDEAAETDPDVMKDLISVVLLAHLFDVPPGQVVADVLKFRVRIDDEASAADALRAQRR